MTDPGPVYIKKICRQQKKKKHAKLASMQKVNQANRVIIDICSTLGLGKRPKDDFGDNERSRGESLLCWG